MKIERDYSKSPERVVSTGQINGLEYRWETIHCPPREVYNEVQAWMERSEYGEKYIHTEGKTFVVGNHPVTGKKATNKREDTATTIFKDGEVMTLGELREWVKNNKRLNREQFKRY